MGELIAVIWLGGVVIVGRAGLAVMAERARDMDERVWEACLLKAATPEGKL